MRGPARIETASLSDPVLVREDGTVLYTFASVVDDIDMGVTDVIRGEDHVANTGVQIELFRALGATSPRFAHHNLIVAASGEEMSKRKGTLSLRSFREAGAEPEAVAAVAVLTGTSDPVRPVQSLVELQDGALLDRLSRAPTKFDPAEVAALSGRILHERPYASVASNLRLQGVPDSQAEAFWLAVRGNLGAMTDVALWRDVVFGDAPGVRTEPGVPRGGRAAASRRAFHGGDLGRMDRCAQGRHRPEGQRRSSCRSASPSRGGARAGAEGAAAPDREGGSSGAIILTVRFAPSRDSNSRSSPSSTPTTRSALGSGAGWGGAGGGLRPNRLCSVLRVPRVSELSPGAAGNPRSGGSSDRRSAARGRELPHRRG